MGGFGFLNVHQQYAEICPVYILKTSFFFGGGGGGYLPINE